MEAVHFALQSWERLGTTDVIKKKKKHQIQGKIIERD